MASKYWIKLYHEILHDPKMGRMSDTLWRRTIELFLLAGEFDQDGILPSIEEMSWTLRISESECNETLHQLQRLQIVHCNDKGKWVVTKFQDRQSAANNTERSRQFRERKQREKRMQPLRQAPEEPESNQNPPIEAPEKPEPEVLEQSLPETEMQRNVAPDTDTDTDTDSVPKGTAAKPPPVGPKTIARDIFLEKTNLKMPDDKPGQRFWWSQFAIIAKSFDDDPTRIELGIVAVVDYMDAENLTITSPKSVVDLCRAQAAGRLKSAQKNGAAKREIHSRFAGEIPEDNIVKRLSQPGAYRL